MKAKLTLSIEADVIEKAKQKAASKKMSLSAIIEDYMEQIIESSDNLKKTVRKKNTITDRIKALTKGVKLPADMDYKKEWHKHLDEKYGN
jgi:molecular chaperone GrpE (heat shock protein)